MLIRNPKGRGVVRGEDIPGSEIASESAFLARRDIVRGLAAAALVGSAFPGGADGAEPSPAPATPGLKRNARYSVAETPNTYEAITTYNNFYEFGTDKDEPARLSRDFKPLPWTVAIDGEAEVRGRFAFEDLVKPHTAEERVYRLRCVEAWSMVVPWMGIPLGDVLARFKPTSKAKYVEFTTLEDPKRMPGQRSRVLDWPYVEGLRIDEAMHPLSFLVTGVYGKPLPNQNGAPLRVMSPWKYGFKGGKSIVRIRFTETQPRNSWNVSAPQEYGFYANVNPAVSHPRWSQAEERRITGTLLPKRQPTLPFNGYASEVASLYAGMDLKRYF